MNDLSSLLSLILLTPLAGAGIIWMLGNRRGTLASWVSVAVAGILMLASLYVLYAQWGGESFHVSVPWLELAPFRLDLGFYLNGVSALMLFVVAFVGFWIHVFSLGYMADDDRKARFFGGLSIFMFSMLGIVLAENLFMLFIFWELVGFSSYILIGHYLTPTAASASQKAFIVNRVGDFGFLLGIILTFWTYGTTSLPGLEALGAHPDTLIALLLFCGVLGKSAQMPLHVWLPDAMAGPTPISALIHAATMVAAGVFLLARTHFLFTEDALQVVGWVGTITAVSAAFWAFAQNDIKKILAYSTLSQLGYMVAAFGFGTLYGLHQEAHAAGAEHAAHGHAVWYGLGAAMFHLTTHAFFKALLFLGSGSVIHACHHEQDIWKMGGLLKKMPITGATFFIGTLALAGLPGLAGFFSKDAILYVAQQVNPVAFGILTLTAVMTATYMGRLCWIAFLGAPRSESAEHAHESPISMTLPLIVLVVLSIFGGYLGLPIFPAAVREFLQSAVPHPEDTTLMLIISAVASLGGLAISYVIWSPKSSADALETKAKPIWALSKSKFYFDELYLGYVNQVQARLAEIVNFFDTVVIAGLGARLLPSGVFGGLGLLFRRLHTGNATAYIWWFCGGVLLFLALATQGFSQLF